MHPTNSRQFGFALLNDGSDWHREVVVEVNSDGEIVAIQPRDRAQGAVEHVSGWALPGMPNLHGHAFQRAMAGLSEFRTQAGDSFWTWRELMYRLAGSLSPEEIETIARHLYIEMLEAGYTSVCEFHYLHNEPDGRPYSETDTLARCILRAAGAAGIGLTLLPVLYQRGGFDGRPLADHQRRFGQDTETYQDLYRTLLAEESGHVRVGIALHSLRAVDEGAIGAILDDLDSDAPIHIHIAEQQSEVEDCLAATGMRPVARLLGHFPVDARWTLIHATHVDPDESRMLAESGATLGLCPTTEANLGDGIFPLGPFLDQGGRWGIGSDSNVSVSPVEELRWLEYGQRLATNRRIVALTGDQRHVGTSLWTAALAGGAAASCRPIGRLEPGKRADLVVFESTPANLEPDSLLDRLVFADRSTRIARVMAGGRWVVQDGRHPAREEAAAAFNAVLARYATQ